MIPQNYYSSTAHVRNRRRDIKGNVLTYTIPGLKKSIDIPFPDRKLPVCKRCKKIYKTRELCRIRDGHTDIPWNTTYICLTMDESCFTRNASGEMRLVDEDSFQFVARSITGPPMPYRARPGTIGGTKAPICMTCKDKNYTRHHCREKQQHQQLPWNTVYVMLAATPTGGYGAGGFAVEDDIRQIGSKRSSSSVSSDDRAPKKMKSEDGSESATLLSTESTVETEADPEAEEDDINKVQTSRAFLLVVGKEKCKVQWLEIDPLVPRPMSNEYNGGGGAWENSENVEPMYLNPGPMMMNGMNGGMHPGMQGGMNAMNGNFNQGWQGFNPSHGPPNHKFNPMMGMNMGMCAPTGSSYPQGAPSIPNNSSSHSVCSDADRYSPNSNNMRQNDRPGNFNSYEQPNFGMNGHMGPGMMNNGQGGGQYGNPPGMYGQQPYPDNRENGHGNNFPSNSHKEYYENQGNGMNSMSNGNNMMGSMNRNHNDYSNGSMNNSAPQSSFPPMNNGMQGGFGGGNGDFNRGSRSNGNGPNNIGGQSFPPGSRGQMDQLSMPHTPQQQGGLYPHPHPSEQYNPNPSNNGKPPVLI